MVIPPVIPSPTPTHELIAALRDEPRTTTTPTDPGTTYSMCIVGNAGRIHDRAVLTNLDWPARTRLHISVVDSVLIVTRDDNGTTEVTGNTHFRIPFRVRRQVAVLVGDSVLLVTYPRRQQLAIHPPTSLNAHFGRPDSTDA